MGSDGEDITPQEQGEAQEHTLSVVETERVRASIRRAKGLLPWEQNFLERLLLRHPAQQAVQAEQAAPTETCHGHIEEMGMDAQRRLAADPSFDGIIRDPPDPEKGLQAGPSGRASGDPLQHVREDVQDIVQQDIARHRESGSPKDPILNELMRRRKHAEAKDGEMIPAEVEQENPFGDGASNSPPNMCAKCGSHRIEVMRVAENPSDHTSILRESRCVPCGFEWADEFGYSHSCPTLRIEIAQAKQGQETRAAGSLFGPTEGREIGRFTSDEVPAPPGMMAEIDRMHREREAEAQDPLEHLHEEAEAEIPQVSNGAVIPGEVGYGARRQQAVEQLKRIMAEADERERQPDLGPQMHAVNESPKDPAAPPQWNGHYMDPTKLHKLLIKHIPEAFQAELIARLFPVEPRTMSKRMPQDLPALRPASAVICDEFADFTDDDFKNAIHLGVFEGLVKQVREVAERSGALRNSVSVVVAGLVGVPACDEGPRPLPDEDDEPSVAHEIAGALESITENLEAIDQELKRL